MRGRGDRLERGLAERELDRMLVTNLVNVRYLTGFTGTNGACVCGPGVRLFLTDFRYTERAEAEVEGWETVTISADWLKGIAERLEGRVGFEDDHVSSIAASSPAVGSRSCAGSRTPASWRRSRRPRSWPTRSGAGASSGASPVEPR
jgi:Xaa-Pro aminopeptidase